MHVLHVIEATIGGTRRHVVDACRGLRRRGVRITLVASALREPRFRADLESLAREGIEVRELPMVRAIRPHKDAAHVLALRRILKELRPDIVHTHSSKAGAIGRLASWSSAVGARVHTPHTFAFLFGAMFSGFSRSLFRTIEKELARKTDRFVAVSADEAATFAAADFIPASKVRVVHNGIDPALFERAQPIERAELGVPQHAPLALVVGLLNVAKGQDLALHALATPALANVHLAFAGSGKMEATLRSLARELGVEARVHFLGWREDVPRLLASCDALLLPSRWEGMPYIVLEAMAAARPVVATPVDGARALLADGAAGRLCRSIEATDISQGLAGVLRLDAASRAELGKAGRAQVRAGHTVEHMVEGLLGVYGELA